MSPPNELVTESLERVLRSSLFKKADRQSRFLRHVVRKHLEGDDDSLREISIGFEVYERPDSYDPKLDPIVRVEASRLRSRLREYYETAGTEDPVRIDIPKGAYVPTFELRVAAPQSLPVETGPSRRQRRKWVVAAAGFPLLALAGIAIVFWPRTPERAKPIESIAILPFADLSEKKNLSHLTEGLTEEIYGELSRIRDLRVAGTASARQASTNPDLQAAARQIGVDALLRGSVRADGEKVRVTVQLLDHTGTGIWSGSFDGEQTGLFDLEERIAKAIAAKLAVQLAVRREGVDVRTAPQRAQAYEYYQQGRALADQESSGPLSEIHRLYELAATTDPSYAPPHAGIAQVLVMSGGDVGGSAYKTTALREANKALELDPGLPLAYSALILYYRDAEMNWAKAQAVCDSALGKLPNSAMILSSCAAVQIMLNRSKALELTRHAVALDPLSARSHGILMLNLYQVGQFDEALSEADTAIRLGRESNFIYRHRALILAAKGDPAAGLKVIDDAQSRLPGVPADWLPVRGYLLGLLHRRAEVGQLIREFTKMGALPHQLALIYLGLGDREKAIDACERALEANRADLVHAISEYYMRVLDGDARFERIKRQLGIVAN